MGCFIMCLPTWRSSSKLCLLNQTCNLINNQQPLSCSGKIKNLCWLFKYTACTSCANVACTLETSANMYTANEVACRNVKCGNTYSCGILIKYLHVPCRSRHLQCNRQCLCKVSSRPVNVLICIHTLLSI